MYASMKARFSSCATSQAKVRTPSEASAALRQACLPLPQGQKTPRGLHLHLLLPARGCP